MSMKRILNEWRRFVNEAINAPKIPYNDDELERKFSVYLETDGEDSAIILYRKQKYVDDFYIIGYASVNLLTDSGDADSQCIPNTYHISAIYVEKELRGQGLGKLMYDLAFGLLDSDEGLTSDKYSGTQPVAAQIWKKIEKSSDIVKRSTTAGNQELDYDGEKTPDDPEDDCPKFIDPSENATDYSLQKTNNSLAKTLLATYVAQHEANDFLNKEDVEKRLLNKAIYRFSETYASGI